jgi:hypothetical protein
MSGGKSCNEWKGEIDNFVSKGKPELFNYLKNESHSELKKCKYVNVCIIIPKGRKL